MSYDFGPYVIWSHEHRAWWRPNAMGYTANIQHAGIYNQDAALEIVRNATHDWTHPPHEIPVRIADLPESAQALLGHT
jgi:hypothetical protein